MVDEEQNPRRSALIGAIILAAVVAAGLWYLLVLREPTMEEVAQIAGTPTATSGDQIIDPQTGQIDQRLINGGFDVSYLGGQQPEPTPTPSQTFTPTPPPQQDVPPSAPTGPAEVALAGVLAAVFGGWFGLRHFARS